MQKKGLIFAVMAVVAVAAVVAGMTLLPNTYASMIKTMQQTQSLRQTVL